MTPILQGYVSFYGFLKNRYTLSRNSVRGPALSNKLELVDYASHFDSFEARYLAGSSNFSLSAPDGDDLSALLCLTADTLTAVSLLVLNLFAFIVKRRAQESLDSIFVASSGCI